MIIKVALTEDELEILDIHRKLLNGGINDILDNSGEELTDEECDAIERMDAFRSILNRIIEVAANEQRIEEGNNVQRCIKVRRPLSEKEKEGLTDVEVFMKEYGLYSASMYCTYWINKFIETYGYIPELP